MNFSTREVSVPAATTGGSKYLSVGINEGVTITGVAAGESSAKKTPFIGVTFAKGDESSQEVPFYMSENAQKISLEKILHIFVDGLGVEKEAVDQVGDKATSLQDYAAGLNRLVPRNNSVRQKFAGEQYQKQDGSIGVRKVVGYVPFIEPMTVKDSKLTYNENSKSDFKKLPVPDADSPVADDKSGDSELPF